MTNQMIYRSQLLASLVASRHATLGFNLQRQGGDSLRTENTFGASSSKEISNVNKSEKFSQSIARIFGTPAVPRAKAEYTTEMRFALIA
ncbi:hypothetical protein [Hyphococcus sp.]|uniref:hypothetical protein n=1 Tax=Hyphococcus sp. TaxID=2038636 RepID=UPI003D136511